MSGIVEDLIDSWTLVDADSELIAIKFGPTRVGFALLLKFLEVAVRFHRHVGAIPRAAVDIVARQLKVDQAELSAYDFAGRIDQGAPPATATAGASRDQVRGHALALAPARQ